MLPDTSIGADGAGLGLSTHSTVVTAKIVVAFQSLLPGAGASAGVIPPPRSRAHL